MFFNNRSQYRTLNTVRISAKALHNNLNTYRRLLPGKAICPVLKSNAYGHGLVEVATALESANPEFFIVDSLYEAYELKRVGIRTPILILGYTFPENLKRKRLPFHFTVPDLATAEALAIRGASVHLKVDTGFNRMGFSLEELEEALPRLKQLNIEIVGLFTHLADSDNPTDLTATANQLSTFKSAIKLVKAHGIQPKWIHAAASAGAIKQDLEEVNLIRLGYSLYGLPALQPDDPYQKSFFDLKPALEAESTLVRVRNVKAGDRISYNGIYTAEHDMTIGVIPFGYYEGLPRGLSNQGWVTVQGKACPIVGRICMNYTMIDLSGVPSAKQGDKVIVFAADNQAKNGIEHAGKLAGSIGYEIVTKLAESIRRQVTWDKSSAGHRHLEKNTSTPTKANSEAN